MSKRKGVAGGGSHAWQPMHRQPYDQMITALVKRKMAALNQGMPYSGHDAVWLNDRYQAFVTYWKRRDGTPIEGEVQEISFKRHDQQWPNDWRDALRIKNEIAGPEVEAVELYPAMSRVVDTANQRFLWCYPQGDVPTWDGVHLIGMPAGMRIGPDDGPVNGSVQRDFDPTDPKPHNYEKRRLELMQDSEGTDP